MKKLTRPLWLAILVSGLAAGNLPAASRPSLPPVERAMADLDTVALEPVEGIWEYAGEEVTVLIRRDQPAATGKYTISVLEAFDPRLKPGTVLGYMVESGEERRFELTHYTRRKKSILDMPGKCVATLDKEGVSLRISSPKSLKIRFNPFTLLPRFWRIITVSSPALGEKEGNAREGLRRVYPSKEGPGVRYKRKRFL